jgi:hypothetical protein
VLRFTDTKILRIWVLLAWPAIFPTGCDTRTAFVPVQTSTAVTLQGWVGTQTFTPLILWPEPEGISVWMPPRHQHTDADYVQLFYTKSFIAPGVEPPQYRLYESQVALPIGSQILPHFDRASVNLTFEWVEITLCGQSVAVQIRETPDLPDSGVAVFELEGTHVAFHWRNTSRASALDVLANHLVQVDQNDADIISAFDEMLLSRFPPTPKP